MKLSVISVNQTNLMDVITDESVYAIVKERCWNGGEPEMKSIGDVHVEDLLSEETIIVRITE